MAKDFEKYIYQPTFTGLPKEGLRNLLRKLGIHSVKSELEYSILGILQGTKEMHGKPDQLFISPSTMTSLSNILSKDKN